MTIKEAIEQFEEDTGHDINWADAQLLDLIKKSYKNKDQIIKELLANVSNLETLIANLRGDHDLLVGQLRDLSSEVEYQLGQVVEKTDHTQSVLQDSLTKQWEAGR